jgi:transposase
MADVRAQVVCLTAGERHRLRKMARGHKTPFRDKLRAQLVLDAARGRPNARIARDQRVTEDTVRKWRNRFAAEGMAGLVDRKRSGRPPRFTPVQVAEIKAMACQLPAESDVPLSKWTSPELADEAVTRRILDSVSASSVRRWLATDVLKPWRHQSWIAMRDPDFRAKATRVLDLYQRVWEGEPLGEDDYVISSDDKPSIQGRDRCHPTLPPGKGNRPMRVEHEYTRRGALCYLAAYDVHQPFVFGRCAPTTGIDPFMALAEQVMTQEPYKSAKRVFWVVDNGSSHRGQQAINRLAQKFPNAIMVHTPVHASWLNQAEVFFSVVQRKVLSPNDFPDLDAVEKRLLAFEKRYNASARPFKWKFTPADLDELLARIARHENEPNHLVRTS